MNREAARGKQSGRDDGNSKIDRQITKASC